MNSNLQYQCDFCLELHDGVFAAEDCCAPNISKVYVCGHCGESFGIDEDAADDCCEVVDPEALPIVSAAELEAAGQIRLIA